MAHLSTSAKVSIASNVLAFTAIGLSFNGFPGEPPLGYAAHKLMHIVGVVIFLGNLIAGPLWVAFAYFHADRRMLAFAATTLAAADIWLTVPGVQLTVWNGICLAPVFGGVRAQPWLLEAVGLVAVAAALALAIVLPIQERFVRACVAGDEPAIRRGLVQWSVWGTLVTVPFGLATWLMVAKAPLFHA